MKKGTKVICVAPGNWSCKRDEDQQGPKRNDVVMIYDTCRDDSGALYLQFFECPFNSGGGPMFYSSECFREDYKNTIHRSAITKFLANDAMNNSIMKEQFHTQKN